MLLELGPRLVRARDLSRPARTGRSCREGPRDCEVKFTVINPSEGKPSMGKSNRKISPLSRKGQERALDPDDVVPRVHLTRPDGIRDRGSTSARILRQAPDRPADALVRAMARPGTAGAGSGWSRTRPIHPAPFHAPLILHAIIRNALGLGLCFGLSISWVRETEFCGQRLAGDCRRRTRENGRNSVRRPRCAPLTDRKCEGFCRPENRGGLPGLHGGAESAIRSLKSMRLFFC